MSRVPTSSSRRRANRLARSSDLAEGMTGGSDSRLASSAGDAGDNVFDPHRTPATSLGFRLWQVQHAWTRRLEVALVPYNLTHMQLVLLATTGWLQQRGEMPTQARLANVAGLDRMMTSKILQLLESKGLITRTPHPTDARAYHVKLSSTGRQTLRKAVPLSFEVSQDFFGRLAPEGRAALGEQLDRLLECEGIKL
jgi:MarR family transcriptional regulator, organic hydroperoxide resistance regulator